MPGGIEIEELIVILSSTQITTGGEYDVRLGDDCNLRRRMSYLADGAVLERAC